MKEFSPVFYVILFVLTIGTSAYYENHGFHRGMKAAVTALEPHLCK